MSFISLACGQTKTTDISNPGKDKVTDRELYVTFAFRPLPLLWAIAELAVAGIFCGALNWIFGWKYLLVFCPGVLYFRFR